MKRGMKRGINMTDDLLNIPNQNEKIKLIFGKKIPLEGKGLPNPETQFILFAYNTQTDYPYWSVKGHFTKLEAAEVAAKNLSRVWHYCRVLEVILP